MIITALVVHTIGLSQRRTTSDPRLQAKLYSNDHIIVYVTNEGSRNVSTKHWNYQIRQEQDLPSQMG